MKLTPTFLTCVLRESLSRDLEASVLALALRGMEESRNAD